MGQKPPNKVIVFLKQIWPTVQRILANFFSFLLRLLKGFFSIVIRQIKGQV